MKIRITAGDWGGDYEAASGKEAIKAFFQDIMAGRIKLCQLSPLGFWTRSDGEKIPFRIAPALFKAGRMTAEGLVSTFRSVDLDFDPEQIAAMVSQDSWMIEPPFA